MREEQLISGEPVYRYSLFDKIALHGIYSIVFRLSGVSVKFMKYMYAEMRRRTKYGLGSSRYFECEGTSYIQLGLLVDGLAITMPGLAPRAFEPLGPMLLSTPCRAMGLSAAIKLAREPVARLSRG